MKPTFALILSLLVQNILAQEKLSTPSSKYSATLKLFLDGKQKNNVFQEFKNGVQYIPLFIELEPGVDNTASLIKAGVEIRTIAGNIITANVPYDQLATVASLPAIKRVELPLLFRKDNDTLMKKYTTVDKVLAGRTPLNMPYTGTGVVIGIIDDGIEFGHPYFLDSAGKTCVDAIWNMNFPGRPPTGFNYGTLWDSDTLNHILSTGYNSVPSITMQQKFGGALHGTPVASLAAGTDGVAPGATLVAVALTAFQDTLLRSDRILDGISFIYNRARSLEKKCIINMSLGTQWGGPHDGKTMVERAIDNFSRDKPDLLICTSVGNDGNNWKHWGGFPINADSSFGFARLAYEGAMYFAIPKRYSSTLRVSVTDSRSPNLNAPAISKDSILYQSPFINIDSIINHSTPVVFTSYLRNGNMSGSIRFTASHYNDDYDELIISLQEFTSPRSGANIDYHVNRFIFKGTGMVHGWFPFFNLHPLYVFSNNPYPTDATYRSTDNNFSSGIPTNAFSVLSSGAYNIRNCYENKLQNKVISSYQSCQLTYFTSLGPTLDGRIKPDIITPGENVVSARSRWDNFMGHEFIIAQDYQMFGGTSASSPITAGIAALIWQKFPSFTRDSVINLIKSTAYSDAYTLAIPNNRAGWGKADAFKALTGISTDLMQLCTQPIICKSIAPPPPPLEPSTVINLTIYPNPAAGTVFIKYNSINQVQLSIYNAQGQLIMSTNLPPAPFPKVTSIPLNYLSKGIYFFRFKGKNYSSTKSILIGK